METNINKIINFKIENINYFENIDNEYIKYEEKLLKKYKIEENIIQNEDIEIIKKNIDLNEGKTLDINFFKELIKRREIYDNWKKLSNKLIEKENILKKKKKKEEKNINENELNIIIDDHNIPIDKNINEKTIPESSPINENIIDNNNIYNNENNLIPDKKIKLKGIKKNDYIKIDEETIDNNDLTNENDINLKIDNKNEKGFKKVNIFNSINNENNRRLEVNIKCISCIFLIILIIILLVFIIYKIDKNNN